MLEIKLEREQIRKDRELAFKEYEILYGEDLYYSRKPVEDYISNKPPKKKKKKMKTIVYSYSESKSNNTHSENEVNEEEEKKADENLRVFLRNKTLKKTLNNQENDDNEKNNSDENNEDLQRENKKNFTALSNEYMKKVSKK